MILNQLKRCANKHGSFSEILKFTENRLKKKYNNKQQQLKCMPKLFTKLFILILVKCVESVLIQRNCLLPREIIMKIFLGQKEK